MRNKLLEIGYKNFLSFQHHIRPKKFLLENVYFYILLRNKKENEWNGAPKPPSKCYFLNKALQRKIAVLRHLEGFFEKSRPPLKLKSNGGLLSDIFLQDASFKRYGFQVGFFPAKHFQIFFFFFGTKNRFQKYISYPGGFFKNITPL